MNKMCYSGTYIYTLFPLFTRFVLTVKASFYDRNSRVQLKL